MKVYKYPLSWAYVQNFQAPIVQCLSVQMQNGVPCLWALVDEEREARWVTLRMVGTGNGDVPPDCTFISTVQSGGYVWHFFEEVKTNG